MTIQQLARYLGAESLGTNVQGFKKITYRGTIGATTLFHMENNPMTASVKPYLRPLTNKVPRAKMVDDAYHLYKHLPDDVCAIRIFAHVTNELRSQGYDVDGLIDSGEALLHPDYDYTNLIK